MAENKECYIGPLSPYFVRVLKTPRELAIAIEGALHLAAFVFRTAKLPWPKDAQEALLAQTKWSSEAQRLKQILDEDDEAGRWPNEKVRLNVELRAYSAFSRANAYEAIHHLLNILEALEDPAKSEDWALEEDAPEEASSEGTLCHSAGAWLLSLGVSLQGGV